MARRAGIKHAAIAAAIVIASTVRIVFQSYGLTAKSNPAISLPKAIAPAIPAAIPAATGAIPRLNTIFKMFAGWAPNAIRIPISFVRRVTLNANTP